MIDIEIVRLYLEMFAYAAAISSIPIIAFQARKETKRNEYELLQSLEERFTDLLWRGGENRNIGDIWKPFSIEKTNGFKQVTADAEAIAWPLWNSIDQSDQDCYRFTRSGLGILEQAFLINQQKWVMNPEIWEKWEAWILSWKQTNPYFPYVLKEVSGWYTQSFIEYLEGLPSKK